MIRTQKRFPLLDEGIYVLTLNRKPKSETRSGYDFWVFDFDAEDEYGMTRPYRAFFFPSDDMLKEVLLAFGGWMDDEGEVEVDEEKILGESLKAEIKHEMIKGKKRAKISKVYRKKEESEEEESPF